MTIDDLHRELGEMYGTLSKLKTEYHKIYSDMREELDRLQVESERKRLEISEQYDEKAKRFAGLSELIERYDGTQDLVQLKLMLDDSSISVPHIESDLVPTNINSVASIKLSASSAYGIFTKGKI